ncbi:MAG TPA: metallophosphoesterase family protein [Thermoguttaceae bacterium]|nr:metallophosphoesterase family protein [Thermoguttaceae bacterium]
MTSRMIAVGDIHGCKAALCALLDAITPTTDDTIVTLGDYVDRGPDSRGVIDMLIALADRCRLIPLLGNHDEMLLEICNGQAGLYSEWMLFGGNATVDSYDGGVPEAVPQEHLDFLRSCLSFYESDRHIFLHGNYLADRPMEQQPPDVLRWDSLKLREPGAHCSGKTVIVGHTAQKNGDILDLGYLRCIDTCCYGDGWLTAMDVDTGQQWQADKAGQLRA